MPAYAQVARDLRARIVNGEVVPGERLPAEAELCALFGVSRSTVREALRVLASERLVTTSRGVQGGTFVAHPATEQVSDFLETSLGLLAGADEVDVSELLEARELLEVPAARLAAQRRTADDLAALRAGLSGGEARDFEGNRGFHETIALASGNRLLAVMSRPVFGVLEDRFQRDRAPKTFWRRVAHDHDRIFQAIAAGDADAAADEMSAHLGRLRTTYRRIDRRRLRP